MKLLSSKNALLTGNLQNILFSILPNIKLKIHIQNFSCLKQYQLNTHYKILYDLFISQNELSNCDILIYFWPKSKLEVIFQLNYIFSLLSFNTKVFILGENKSGVKCAARLLKKWIMLTKIDTSHHCILYFGNIIFKPVFIYDNYINYISWNKITIKTIPGVFSYNKIDDGTKLLISTFKKLKTRKQVLDLGCGSGILSIALKKYLPKIKITLVDSNIAAIESSTLTLKSNKIQGNIIVSDIYSNILNHRFDLIVSNPPLHNNRKFNLEILKNIINNSVKHLFPKGKIRIVILKNISCHKIFMNNFTKYTIIKKNNHYKIYEANYDDIIKIK